MDLQQNRTQDTMNPEQPEQSQQNSQDIELSMAFRMVLFVLSWLFWVLFLFVPTVSGIHGTAFLDITNSVVFMMIGLVFCTAQNNAFRQRHTFQMSVFAAGMTILSIWF